MAEDEINPETLTVGLIEGSKINNIENEEIKKMEGIDPTVVAMLNNNENDDILKWLIVLGFLGKDGGLFGGGSGSEAAAVAAGATQAKLDCLAQGQQDAALAAHATATQVGFNSLSTQLSECCCNLKSGQKDIVNELCKQTQVIVAAGLANTQRTIDAVDKHAEAQVQEVLSECKLRLSNVEQTKELSLLITQACNCNDNGHGR